MEALIARAHAEFEGLEQAIEAKFQNSEPVTYEFVAREQEAQGDRLGRPWHVVTHLKSVCDSEGIRKAVETVQPKMVEFNLKCGQSKTLFKAWEYILEHEGGTLSASQRRIVERELIDLKLSGIGLEGDKQARFKEIQQRLADLSTKFSNNVLDATKAFTVRLTDKAAVKGLPESALSLAAQTARQKHEKASDEEKKALEGDDKASAEAGPWVFTLDFPSYFPIMQYANDRKLREQMYRAHSTRATEFTVEKGSDKDNAPVIAEVLTLRTEKAKLLGYKNYAEVSMVKKMATLDSALKLMGDLRKSAGEK